MASDFIHHILILYIYFMYLNINFSYKFGRNNIASPYITLSQNIDKLTNIVIKLMNVP